MANERLRKCPTCNTPVADTVSLGLRNYEWLAPFLPGRVAPSDLDCVLERNGKFLVLEMKPPGVALPMGQRILLKNLVRLGVDVWVCWGEDPVLAGAMDRYGDVKFTDEIPQEHLAKKVTERVEQAGKAR